MTFWDRLETPLIERPLFPVDAKDHDPASEHKRQSELVGKLRARGLRVTAIPNARCWGMKAWNRAKAEGAEWGAADLIVNAPGGLTAYIEMKNGRADPEQHQIDWLNSRHKMGFPVGVFRRADSAIAFLAERGFPVGVRDAA